MFSDNSEAPGEVSSHGGPASGGTAKYQVLTELGRGGAGVVNLALSRGIGGFSKLVVLKTIKEDLRERKAYVGMFLDEAKLAARMNHPNVVQTYEVYKQDGVPVIVMEYLDGRPFSEVRVRAREDPRLNELMTVSILCKVLAGLDYAHNLTDFRGKPLGIIHRDATPHNVLLTYQGQIKLLDFGIAKLSVSREQTDIGVIKGKLDYMSPEQIQAEPLDRRTDIFAVGVMLWEGLARRRMWSDLGDTEVMQRILSGRVPALKSVKADIEPELELICERALARDKAARYATAAEFQSDLERYLAARGGMVPEAQIGALVSETGAESRKRMQAVIESKLEALATDAAMTNEDAQRAIESLRAQAPSSGVVNSMGATVVLATGAHRTRRWRLASGVAGLGLALVSVLLWNVWAARRDVTEHGAPERDRARAAMASPKSERVRLELLAEPSGATLYLDGLPVESNPFTALVPRDGAAHSVRASAPGFITRTEPLSFESNLSRRISLEPVAQTPPAPSSAPPARAAAISANRVLRAKVVRSSSVSCDPPYIIDEFGIKRYRRECLPQQ